jgi:hypothetical protein
VSNEAEQPVSDSDEVPASTGERIVAAAAAAADAGPVNEAARLRRPSSLRAGAPPGESADASGDAASGEVQRPKLTPPPLRRKLTPPPFLRHDFKPQTQTRSTDPITPDAGSPDEAGPSPSQKLVTLVSERPEVGLGIAFAAGLVIATILKRLAR